MTWIRRTLSASLLALAGVVLLCSTALAGDPYVRWYTIETPHFTVTYSGGLEPIAQRTASLAEAVRERLAGPLVNRPTEIVHILLTDFTDSANGSATIVPYDAIRLFVTAPEDLSTLGDYDDWLTELVTHESAHVHHIDNITGFPTVPNAIFGKIYAPNQVQPSWIREGIAVAMESLLTSGGRVRSSMFDMFLRADVLEHNFASLDQMSQDVRRWPGGDIPYLYGGKFMGWLLETYGDDVIGAVATDYGANLIPWGINRSVRRATGRTYPELYYDWHASLARKYLAQADAIRARGLRIGTRLTHAGYSAASPRWVPARARAGEREELLYYRDDGHLPAGLYRLPLVSRRKADESDVELVARTSGSPRVGSFDAEGGIVFDCVGPSVRRHNFDDLHHLGPHEASKTGRIGTRDRWTVGLRARAPDVSPDGRHVAFITNHAGTMTPRIADILPDGGLANERRLVATSLWDQAFTPRFSPDGKRVAYSSWTAGGYRDVWVVDVATGAIQDLTHDRAQDLEPSWTPDGKWIVWSSDRTGVPNIYAYEVATGVVKQVTNVLFGAFMPEVSPDGRTLVYVGYTSAGFDLFSMPFDERAFLDAPRPEPMHPEPRPNPPPKKWPVSDYDPWVTFRPHNYSLTYAPSVFGQALTIGLSGGDIAGLQSFACSVIHYSDTPEVTGGCSYTYSRLPFDLKMSASRSLSAHGVKIAGRNIDEYDDSLGFTSGVNYSIPGEFETTSMNLSYSAVSYIRKYPAGLTFDPSQLGAQPVTTRQYQGIVHAGVSYNNAYSSLWAISSERGFSASLSTDLSGLATGSGVTLTRFDGHVAGYLLAPWLRHHVFALQLSAGTASGSASSLLTRYSTGGYFTQGFTDTLSDFTNALGQGSIVLRGYPPQAFNGSQYNLANLEYRFPIAIIERGFSTLPLFVDYVSGALFLDYGGAFDTLDLNDLRNSYHAGVGGELHFGFTLGYFLDTAFTIGWADALDKRAVPKGQDTQTYVVITGSF